MKNEPIQYKNFGIGLACMDALPVLCFLTTVLCISKRYDSFLFLIGAICCILAGSGKVLWKFLLAIKGIDYQCLTKPFRLFMFGGFLIMILSLFTSDLSVSVTALWKELTGFPQNYFYFIGFICIILMIILARKLNQHDAKHNWIEQCINLLAQISILLGVITGSYVNDYYHADMTCITSMSSANVSVIEKENGYLYDGDGDNRLFIFYPGAKVESKAYHAMMISLAEAGWDAYLVEMPANLAFFGKNIAGDIIETTNYDAYYIGGHSLGGAMAASFASEHEMLFDGIVFLGSYSTNDLSSFSGKILSLYGSQDQILNRKNLVKNRANMPDNYTEIEIPGGNHCQFGDYGFQTGDGPSSISANEQQQIAVNYILQTFN